MGDDSATAAVPIPASTTLLTEDEAAVRLGCDANTVRRICRHYGLPFLPGKPMRIAVHDLDAYIRQFRADLVADEDIGEHLITTDEIGRRLNMKPAKVRQYLDRHGILYDFDPLLVVRNRELWDFLIEARHVRRRAFGLEPLHPHAEGAFARAVERLVAERLSELELEDQARVRRSEAATERAARQKAVVVEKARRAGKRSGASRKPK
jgi:hypothetical protein